MEQPDLLEWEGNVHFRMTGHLPKWPQECVVCGRPCLETFEVRSQVTAHRGQPLFERGTRTFPVPLHANNADCISKFRHPQPLGIILSAVVLAAVVGFAASTFVRPDLPARIFVFCVGTIMALVPVWMLVLDRYPPYASIWESGGVDYTVGFRHESLARKFADLNREIIQSWHRPKGDISVNIFPRKQD